MNDIPFAKAFEMISNNASFQFLKKVKQEEWVFGILLNQARVV